LQTFLSLKKEEETTTAVRINSKT